MKTRKIDNALEEYKFVGYIHHELGCGTANALLHIIGDDVLVIAPLAMHVCLHDCAWHCGKSTKVSIITPQYFIRHPNEGQVNILYFNWKPNYIAVFRKKEQEIN